MVAADLPVAGLVRLKEFDALQPFGAFRLRQHQAHRAAVIGFDGRARPGVGEQRVLDDLSAVIRDGASPIHAWYRASWRK